MIPIFSDFYHLWIQLCISMCSLALQRWVKQKLPFILTGIVLSNLIPGYILLDLHLNLEQIDSEF